MRHFTLFFPFFLSRIISGQVVFNEVLFDPAGNESHDEFVELVNISGQLVDLSGWQFSDSSATDELTDAGEGLIAQPYQYIVILDGSYFGNSTAYENRIPENALIITISDNSLGSAGLSNSKPERLQLSDGTGQHVDTYRYSTGNSSGYSDEKIDRMGGNDVLNWTNSKISGGTPGSLNSVSPADYDLELVPGSLSWTPVSGILPGTPLTISFSLHNTGRQSFINKFRVVLRVRQIFPFPDDFQNISSWNEGTDILPDGSTTFTTSWAPALSALYELEAELEATIDQRPENNRITAELQVSESGTSLHLSEIKFLTREDEAEWVELYNAGANPVLLTGWGLADKLDTIRIDTLAYLFPDQYKVLSRQKNIGPAFSLPDSLILPVNLPSLNNTEDEIYLLLPGGGWEERVAYSADWLEGEDWRLPSLERILFTADASRQDNWGPSSAADGATPGAPNAIRAGSAGKSSAKVKIEPNPFSPDGDGFEDHAVIRAELPVNSARYRLHIFDLAGRKIQSLADNTYTGSTLELIWNGRDERERLVSTGIYIIWLQVLDDRSGVLLENKNTVVVVRTNN